MHYRFPIFRWHGFIVLCVAAALNSGSAFNPQSAMRNPQSEEPNELGKVLILEYHLIQPEETRWGRSIAHFKQDLDLLYRSGYRPVGMGDYVSGKMALPAGARPVIFTFDDSSPGQFRYLVREGKRDIDPDCAVGMLIDFHKKHPDFGLKGIFFVLPEAKEPHKLFGQPEYEAEKLRQLVALGFEIGNHTLWHANLSKYDAQTVQKQLALAVKEIGTMVPGYVPRALALPLGMFPKDHRLAVQGAYNGTAYRNDAILEVAGGPVPSPFSRNRDLEDLTRIQVTGRELEGWVKRLQEGPGGGYVSDGKEDTVTFPRALASEANSSRFPDLHFVSY